jgi:hypothetical protein
VRHERTVHSNRRIVIAASSRPAKRQRTSSGSGDEIEPVTSPTTLAPEQQTVPEDIVNINVIPRRESDCFASPSPTSPVHVEHYTRRSSVFSNHDGMQPLTPPVSDSSGDAIRKRGVSPVIAENGNMNFGEMQNDMDFSILFPTNDSKDDDTLGSSPLGQNFFPSVTAVMHDAFPDHEQQFPEFGTLDNILEGASSHDGSMTDLFHDAVVDGMTPIEEFIIPQAPPTRLRDRRETGASDTSDHSFISSMAQKPAPSFVIDDSTRDWIIQDLAASHPRDLINSFCLPSSHSLQRYLDSYFNSFHKNFPILHLPTFYPKGTKALLLLSVCCIGAQYCLEKRRARYLFEWTKRFLAIEDVKWKRVEVERKAWLLRSKILLGFFGIWSAERELVSDALAEQGSYAGVSFTSHLPLQILMPAVFPFCASPPSSTRGDPLAATNMAGLDRHRVLQAPLLRYLCSSIDHINHVQLAACRLLFRYSYPITRRRRPLGIL